MTHPCPAPSAPRGPHLRGYGTKGVADLAAQPSIVECTVRPKPAFTRRSAAVGNPPGVRLACSLSGPVRVLPAGRRRSPCRAGPQRLPADTASASLRAEPAESGKLTMATRSSTSRRHFGDGSRGQPGPPADLGPTQRTVLEQGLQDECGRGWRTGRPGHPGADRPGLGLGLQRPGGAPDHPALDRAAAAPSRSAPMWARTPATPRTAPAQFNSA